MSRIREFISKNEINFWFGIFGTLAAAIIYVVSLSGRVLAVEKDVIDIKNVLDRLETNTTVTREAVIRIETNLDYLTKEWESSPTIEDVLNGNK